MQRIVGAVRLQFYRAGVSAPGVGHAATRRGKFSVSHKNDDGVPLTPGTRVHALHQWCRSHLDQGLIFHAGKVLSLGSVLASDWLVLRLAMASASVCSVMFHFLFPDPRPMRMFYGALFGTGHLLALFFFLYSKSDAFWSIPGHDDRAIYEKHFKPFGISHWEFLQIRKLATVRRLSKDEVLARQGDEMPCIWLVLEGELRSHRRWNEDDAAAIGPKQWAKFQECTSYNEKYPTLTYPAGIWAGELYDKHYDWNVPHHWRVTFEAQEPSVLLEVKRRPLWDFVHSNPHVERLVDAMQLKDLWRSRRQAAMTRLIQMVEYETRLSALENELSECKQASIATSSTATVPS